MSANVDPDDLSDVVRCARYHPRNDGVPFP